MSSPFRGYNATVQQVVRENEAGYLPPLKTKIDRIEQYDLAPTQKGKTVWLKSILMKPTFRL
jgi:hypothetical protein